MAPHLAASVILLRERRNGGLEVCMLRRRRGASFMASAFVFPGGGVDPGETLQECAARELFEEAGVALVTADRGPVPGDPAELEELRRAMTVEGASAAALLAAAGLRWDEAQLTPWSHWITPSLEPKRFSAHFFVAVLPAGQEPQVDAVETVQQVWLDPRDAETRAAELALPPPQLRTLWELRELGSIADVMAAARARAAEPHPVLPRVSQRPEATAPAVGDRPGPASICLLLPWDPDYLERGQGEALSMLTRPSWATGPSRFVMEDRAWRHLDAPGSTTAG